MVLHFHKIRPSEILETHEIMLHFLKKMRVLIQNVERFKLINIPQI